MSRNAFARRQFIKAVAGGALALPFYQLVDKSLRRAVAAPKGGARRFIVFYFPDGVAGIGADGSPSLWDPTGAERGFVLGDQLQPLSALRDQCVFLSGLSMGPTDSGSHPGGAKKLLTGVDGGGGESIDRFLARTAGAGAPFRHVYLGAMATQNSASGDKHISYVGPGTTAPPEDKPWLALARLFGTTPGSGGTGMGDSDEASVIDTALADLNDLRGRLGDTEKAKLDLHLGALREVEQRVKGLRPPPSCTDPRLDTAGLSDDNVFDPAQFPKILRAQTDLLVQAMACGLTQVGVLQSSMHTSELIMSRFPGTEMYDAHFDMRSHQASHYGPSHDPGKREFHDYVLQRRWFMAQLAYLLEQLKARPEEDGTMLDYTLVLACSEISDGNTHSHDNMPLLLCGGAGGALSPGRLLRYPGRRHSDLLVSIAHAMNQRIPSFGQASTGPLPGLLSG
mgnify:CR=1 FL=1